MKIQKLPVEETAKILLLKGKLQDLNKDVEAVYVELQKKRSVVSKLEEDLVMLKRELGIKYGGNTNWKVDDDGECVVLQDQPPDLYRHY